MNKFVSKLTIGLIISFSVISALNAQDEYPGFEKTASGIYYKILEKGNVDLKPSVGDILTIDMLYKDVNDSVIFDSRNNKQIFMLPLAAPMYPGDINEAMSILSVGDSALFILAADSFFIKTVGLPEIPDFIDKGGDLFFTLKLKDFMTEEEYMSLIEKQRREEKKRIAKLKEEENGKILDYIKEKGIKATPRESGLYYIVLEEGKGEQAVSGKTVKVHYTGTFLNGEKFDSSYDRGQPIEFVLGQGRVIKGWEEGIALMKEGGKAKLIIPSDIAYGERGGGAIPPVTPLVFEVELVEVK